MATPRLSLPEPTGTDLISGGDDAISALAGVLDDAAIFAKGVFASRPAASALDGKFYLATDISILYLSDGTNWHEVSRGGGAVPVGGMLDYAGDADPGDTRYMLCDGRAISRSTFATLFALIGEDYGVGNGTTTFNIPDTRGRVTVSPDNMATAAGAASRMASNNTLAASGGTETKTIAEANLPAHVHGTGTLVTASNGSHDHNVGTLATASTGAHDHGGITGSANADHAHSMSHDHALQMGNDYPGTGSVPAPDNSVSFDAGGGGSSAPIKMFNGNTGGMSAQHQHSISSAGAHTHTISGAVASNGAHTHTISGSTASVGSGTALNGMPPYLVVNKIIRVS